MGADVVLHRLEAAADPVLARSADRRIPFVGPAVRLDAEADGTLWFGTGLGLGLAYGVAKGGKRGLDPIGALDDPVIGPR